MKYIVQNTDTSLSIPFNSYAEAYEYMTRDEGRNVLILWN